MAAIADLTTEEKIVTLYKLQQIDSKMDDINFIKGELPLEVADLEDVIEGYQTRISNLNAEIENLSKEGKSKKEEIENCKALIAKYEEQQKEVRNNREYESFSKEIEYQKLEIELCEKRIKEFSAESKAKKKIAEELKEQLEGRKVDLANKKEELATIENETAAEVAELEKQAGALAAKIDERLLSAYKRIRQNVRNGLAVVTVKRDACGGCFNRIPPQRQLDIRMGKKVIVCEYCGRVLVSDLIEE
ncbi:Hypothetical protein BN938_2107 [Mucinivorans hirudinis]|uniref:C4-type zinc ribbon domain-containing protein n=1 Tax=Mucinivorans hirudinis TaxID=1433126 RepID=A0A060R9A4_9BACT|nr:Hypothetical protein BN938_2107 [Mucinivorans hirudinis]